MDANETVKAGPVLEQEVLDILPDAILVVDHQGLVRQANAQAEKLFGYAPGGLMGVPVDHLVPEHLRAVHEKHRERFGRHPHMRAMSVAGELMATRRDGTKFSVEISLSPLHVSAGSDVIAVIRDVEERKQHEIRLRESEEKYRSLVQLSPEAIVVHRRGEILYANDAARDLFGVPSAEQLVGQSLIDLAPEEYRAVIRQRINGDLPGDRGEPIDMVGRKPDGTEVMLQAMGARFPYKGEQAAQVILRDVTARKKAERELLRVNRALKALGDVNHTLVRSADERSFLTSVCHIICEVGGHRMVWVGYALNDPFKTVEPVAWEGIEDGYMSTVPLTWDESEAGNNPVGIAIRTGRPYVVHNVRTELQRTDWQDEALRRGYKSILASPLLSAGKAFGALVINASESDAFDERETALLSQLADDLAYGIVALRAQQDRDRAEAELRASREELRDLSSYLQSAREAERTAVAREIHDELGQALTALKMDAVWIEHALTGVEKLNPANLLQKANAMETLIDRTIKTVRRIATELRPVLLDSLGLVAAIEWLAEDFASRTGIRCTFAAEPEEIELDRERSTALFRICQEALTNVLRHAQATVVEIMLLERDPMIELGIRDNGRGITGDQLRGGKSFGLLGMRERAHLFGGTVEITGVPGKGTTVRAMIERGAGGGN